MNGSLITSGKNFYYPEPERRAPDGRLSLENGSFSIPLHRGHNEIVIACIAQSTTMAALERLTAGAWLCAMTTCGVSHSNARLKCKRVIGKGLRAKLNFLASRRVPGLGCWMEVTSPCLMTHFMPGINNG